MASGPLVWKDNFEKKAIIVGIVSWGHNCGQIGYPSMYSKVDHVLPWIHETIDKYSNEISK